MRGHFLYLICHNRRGVLWGKPLTRQIEVRSLHVLVSSEHPLADEQVAEALARVLSRYAVDFRPGVEVKVPHDGEEVTYVANAHKSFLSYVRAAKTASEVARSNRADR